MACDSVKSRIPEGVEVIVCDDDFDEDVTASNGPADRNCDCNPLIVRYDIDEDEEEEEEEGYEEYDEEEEEDDDDDLVMLDSDPNTRKDDPTTRIPTTSVTAANAHGVCSSRTALDGPTVLPETSNRDAPARHSECMPLVGQRRQEQEQEEETVWKQRREGEEVDGKVEEKEEEKEEKEVKEEEEEKEKEDEEKEDQ
ncbi:unnamed protein product [Closterium sp. NIES-53]